MADGDQTRIREYARAGKRLGRHVNHDPRSRQFRAPVAGVTPTSKVWKRHTGPYDQGDLGSCTGNAIAGLVMTDPVWNGHRRLHEASAVKIYKKATVLDPFPGQYPPDDTGSDGLDACRAAVSYRYATQYLWGFGIYDMVRIISAIGPCAVGTDWMSGMDRYDPRGLVGIDGSVRGGHEYEVLGVHLDTSLGAPIGNVFECQQSWGPGWGVKGTDGGLGRFYVRINDMATLLERGGDVVTLATNTLKET